MHTLRRADPRATLSLVQWVLASSVSAALVAIACGGNADKTGSTSAGPDPVPSGGAGGTGGGSREDGGGSPPGSGGIGGSGSGLPDARYEDPGCKPEKKIQGPRECDTVSQTGCSEGERCVPHVTYGANCESEEISTRCDIAGEGTQGDDCTFELCAGGFVCVTGGAGFVCARLCTMSIAGEECPPGLLCSPLDVDGFAVCS